MIDGRSYPLDDVLRGRIVPLPCELLTIRDFAR